MKVLHCKYTWFNYITRPDQSDFASSGPACTVHEEMIKDNKFFVLLMLLKHSAQSIIFCMCN